MGSDNSEGVTPKTIRVGEVPERIVRCVRCNEFYEKRFYKTKKRVIVSRCCLKCLEKNAQWLINVNLEH